jgi:acetolactate synthase small subunit
MTILVVNERQNFEKFLHQPNCLIDALRVSWFAAYKLGKHIETSLILVKLRNSASHYTYNIYPLTVKDGEDNIANGS